MHLTPQQAADAPIPVGEARYITQAEYAAHAAGGRSVNHARLAEHGYVPPVPPANVERLERLAGVLLAITIGAGLAAALVAWWSA